MSNMMNGGINLGNSTQSMRTYGQPMDMGGGYVNRTNMVGNSGYPYYGAVQQQQTAASYPMIIGKFVDSETDIAPVEVPNDGKNVGIFVQRDAQRIYMKQVGGDGLIHGYTYVLEQQTPAAEPEGPTINDILNDISNRLDGIEKSLAKQRKPYNPNYKRNNYRPNQEGKNNE